MRPASASERLAPAKVNLFLHVGPLGSDGYHPINSLMAFADMGDRVKIASSSAMEFVVEGPFADHLADGSDNLVTRARDAVLTNIAMPCQPFRLTLHKALPVASGLGGGSSDAATTLLLLKQAFAPAVSDEVLQRLALGLGSDVPACLRGIAAIATGRGERLAQPPKLPDLDVVLINPAVPSITRAVYAAFDESSFAGDARAPLWPSSLGSLGDVARFLAACRNDLETPAIGLRPEIGQTLSLLRSQPETLLARMSGSGATCFALCESSAKAASLAGRLAKSRPDWWVRAARLGGFRSPLTNP